MIHITVASRSSRASSGLTNNPAPRSSVVTEGRAFANDNEDLTKTTAARELAAYLKRVLGVGTGVRICVKQCKDKAHANHLWGYVQKVRGCVTTYWRGYDDILADLWHTGAFSKRDARHMRHYMAYRSAQWRHRLRARCAAAAMLTAALLLLQCLLLHYTPLPYSCSCPFRTGGKHTTSYLATEFLRIG
jgi:hypothetical protein